MRWLRRLAALAVAVYAAVFLGLLGFVQFYDPLPALPKDAVIVVLGAGQKPDGSLGAASLVRVEAAVALFKAGTGTLLIMTGGYLRHERGPVGTAMAEAARAAGVPDAAILVEDRALSTLQNALFTADILGPSADQPLILVTQRFHLPRAWASFRWAGMRNLALYPADTSLQHWQTAGIRAILRETFKTPPNAVRALAASAASLAGIPEPRYIRLLD